MVGEKPATVCMPQLRPLKTRRFVGKLLTAELYSAWLCLLIPRSSSNRRMAFRGLSARSPMITMDPRQRLLVLQVTLRQA